MSGDCRDMGVSIFFLFSLLSALDSALTVSSHAGLSQSSCLFMNMSSGDFSFCGIFNFDVFQFKMKRPRTEK